MKKQELYFQFTCHISNSRLFINKFQEFNNKLYRNSFALMALDFDFAEQFLTVAVSFCS